MRSFNKTCSILALIIGLSPTSLLAQTRAAPAPAAAAPADDDQIVVTARKREERAIDVPIALSAVSGAVLEQRGIRNVADVLQETPGISLYDYGSGITKVAIRGVSTSLGANDNGYYLDDLPFTGVTVPLVPDVRAWDLDRVEVLRGPQGTLFGEGSLGGTVRILTKNADLDNWEAKGSGYLSDTRGGGTNQGIKGAFNAPIIPGVLAFRVAGTEEKLPGWIDNDVAGQRNVNDQSYTTFRAKVRFDPTSRLSINGSYWFYKANAPAGQSDATDNNQLSQSSVLATAVKYRLYGVSARYDLSGVQAFYSYSHNKFALPQTGALLGGSLIVDIGVKVDAHEARIASTGDGPFQWTVGGYLRNAERTDLTQFAIFSIDNISNTTSKARALFGEGTYTLPFAPIDLTAGLRYYSESVRGVEIDGTTVTNQPGDTYKSWNPRFSIAWHPRQDMTVYASAAKGFRSGQLQPSVSAALAGPLGITLPDALAQDSIWTYELGAKADLLDRLLTLEGAVYYSKWKNVTVRIPLGTTGFNGLINSKGTEVKGAELAATLRPINGLVLALGGSYTDATYVGAIPGTGIVDGAIVDDVSKFTANASADYHGRITDSITGFGRVSWQHNSPRRFTSFAAYEPGDTINRVDARIGVELGTVSLALFADNLTNENGAVSFRAVQPLPSGDLDITALRMLPRTLGIELSATFGGGVR